MKSYLLIITHFIFLNGFSQNRKADMFFIPGPTINLGYNEVFSAGLGVHLDVIYASSAGRAGHWNLHNFLFDYDWNYFFETDRHLSEELGLTYFYSYLGVSKSPWKLCANFRLAHHTNFVENSFSFSPSVGMTWVGLLEFRAGYCFYFDQLNAMNLNNTFTTGIFFRPLMKNHWGFERISDGM